MTADSKTPRTDAELLRLFIREYAPGGCKMLTLGDACACPLCQVDSLTRALRSTLAAVRASIEAAGKEPVTRYDHHNNETPTGCLVFYDDYAEVVAKLAAVMVERDDWKADFDECKALVDKMMGVTERAQKRASQAESALATARAAERERCAKVCEDIIEVPHGDGSYTGLFRHYGNQKCAQSIRALTD